MIKIYDIGYLSENDLSDDDLHYLIDTVSLQMSLIVGMFKFINSKMNQDKIIEVCKKDNNWIYENHWTLKQRSEYEKKIEMVYKNVYQYSSNICKQKAEWFSIVYGFSIKN